MDRRTLAESVLAVGRLGGHDAAVDEFARLREEAGLTVADLDAVVGLSPGVDFQTLTYVKQWIGAHDAIENLARGILESDATDAEKAEAFKTFLSRLARTYTARRAS